MSEWINSNQWVFSGVGVAVVAGIGKLLLNRFSKKADSPVSQNQSSGSNSNNNQAGRDINMNQTKRGEDS